MFNKIILFSFLVFTTNYSMLTYLNYRVMGIDYILSLFLLLIMYKNYKYDGFKVLKNYTLVFIILFLYIITLHFLNNVDGYNRLFVGSIITTLFAIYFIVFYSLQLRTDSQIFSLFKGILYIILICTLSSYFDGVFVTGDLINTLSLRNSPGLFRDQAYFSTTLNIGLIISLSCYLITKRKIFIYISLFISVTVILTVFRKSIVSLILIWLIYYFLFYKGVNRFKHLSFALLCAISLVIIFGDNAVAYFIRGYQDYIVNTDAARNLLYLTSIDLFYSKFPIGSGMGTFASVPTKIWYSDVYYEYGLNNIYGLTPGIADTNINVDSYVLDAYWAHIIGELGFIGVSLFSYIWLYPVKISFQLKNKSKIHKIYYFFVLTVIMSITLESTGSSYAEQSQYILIYSGIVGIITRRIKSIT